jgi:cytochrome c oxidase cbb3-type subunit IV
MEEALVWLRSLWLLWLMLLFLGIVAWAFWPGRRRRMESHGRIPLEDDQAVRPPPRDDGRRGGREGS